MVYSYFNMYIYTDMLARRSRHVMLVGSGSGKTSVINQYLDSLDKDTDGFLTSTINMSYYTDSNRYIKCLTYMRTYV
jgi:Ni2+-binding GTPase involved in maturation of urease and hydrogenase